MEELKKFKKKKIAKRGWVTLIAKNDVHLDLVEDESIYIKKGDKLNAQIAYVPNGNNAIILNSGRFEHVFLSSEISKNFKISLSEYSGKKKEVSKKED